MNPTPNEPFVPLNLGVLRGNERPDFRVKILSQAESAQPFQSVQAPRAGPAPGSHNPSCLPRVTLEREDDRVSGIRIQCSCGQVIELACVYQPES